MHEYVGKQIPINIITTLLINEWNLSHLQDYPHNMNMDISN